MKRLIKDRTELVKIYKEIDAAKLIFLQFKTEDALFQRAINIGTTLQDTKGTHQWYLSRKFARIFDTKMLYIHRSSCYKEIGNIEKAIKILDKEI